MKKISFSRVLPMVMLALVVLVTWGTVCSRLSVQDWKIPTEYEGDGLEFIGWIKTAAEGDFIPFGKEGSYRLAAPYHADWADYPATEKFLIYFLGQVSKVIGLFQACNFGMVLEHLLSAISFYLCCRILRYSRTWSFVGALLFSFTYYTSLRGLGHLHLACIYTLPWAILSCWLVLASKSMKLGDRFSWICLGTALVMGLSGPYNLNMYCQLLCFSLLAQYSGRRRRENLRIGIFSLGMVMVGFLSINARSLMYEWAHGKNAYALARNYFECELYALKPIEFLIPPNNHHSAGLAAIGDYYSAQAWVRGEMFSPYLGIIGLAGLAWLFGEGILRLIRDRKNPRRFPAYALQVSWIIFYSLIGGANCVLALCGMQLFRASNRYSIYVSAITMLFLVSRASVLSRRCTTAVKFGLAGLFLLVGLYDELPRQPPPAQMGTMERTIESDRIFGAQLEEKLPPAGMVYELPIFVFPEAPPIRDVSGYEMLRPFFYTKTIRFSYGAIRGRSREDWQKEVEKMPAPQMIAALEKYGFSAILLNRKCYADGGEGLVKQLAAAGREQIINDGLNEQVCVLLHPSAQPVLPHTDDRAQLLFRSGWAIKEQSEGESRQWSSGDASLSFFSESRYPATYTLKCVIGSISPRRVSIEMKGKEVWSGEIGAGQGVAVNVVLDGDHGNNYLKFKTDQEAVQPKGVRTPLAFTVVNLEITRNN